MTPLNRFDLFPYGPDVTRPSSLRNPDGFFPENDVPPPDPVAVLIGAVGESIMERVDRLKSRIQHRRERPVEQTEPNVACQ